MNQNLHRSLRPVLFILFALGVLWLGMARPKVLRPGAEVAVVRQGTNVTFEPGLNRSVLFTLEVKTSSVADSSVLPRSR